MLQEMFELALTNYNHLKAKDLLDDRFENLQLIITSHMNRLLKLKRINSDRDINAVRKFYNEIRSNIRSLESFGIDLKTRAPSIGMERLLHQKKLTVSRNLKEGLWDLSKNLNLINEELKARENVFLQDQSKL